MASLSTANNLKIFLLPTEILAEIITSDILSTGDISRCQQVCKLFRDIIQRYAKHEYILQVEHRSQQAWRLARCLLAYPKLGESFRSITVAWISPPQYIVTDSGTELLRWSWTPEEKDKISSFAGSILGRQGLRAVYWGVECASLVPLLLCFMPNLKYLDLGADINPKISEAYLREQRRIMAKEKICVNKAIQAV
ncbi:hypothetical protein TWF730_000882 [Orbilia blumenaviensis]|uniref:F-box domain-containing protein n=1 Tax=Orbilia blumenaviensis TaxID=1796055 RepID=A0AAV9VMY0_9PEZI